jgi:hypothetical protein
MAHLVPTLGEVGLDRSQGYAARKLAGAFDRPLLCGLGDEDTLNIDGQPKGRVPAQMQPALALTGFRLADALANTIALGLCRVSLVAAGLSQATNSTSLSIRLARNATLRPSRSSLAML